MFSNGRYFPPEYYKITKSNSIRIRGRWFVNRPLSPICPSPNLCKNNEKWDYVQNSSISSSGDNSYVLKEDTIISDLKDVDYTNSTPSIPTNMNGSFSDFSDDDSLKDPDFVPSDPDSDESENNSDKILENTSPPTLDMNSKIRSSTSSKDLNSSKEDDSFSSHLLDHHAPSSSIVSVEINADNAFKKTSSQDITVSTGISCNIQPANYKLNGELRKGQKGKDFCFFCETAVLNFARHIQRNHSIETEVQKIFSHPKNSKDRKEQLSLLRKKGNYLTSIDNPKPVKQPTVSELLPCTSCLGFYSAKQLWRHRKRCVGTGVRTVRADAQNFLIRNIRIDTHFKETVLKRMRADEVSLVAKKDPLICEFGSRYIQKNRSKHLVHVASVRMRELAKLLMEVRKREPLIKDLFSALKPEYYDNFVEATKIVAKYDNVSEYYKVPTYAMNIATSLKQCCDIGIKFALKKKHVYGTLPAAEAEADIRTLKQLIESEWNYDVSSRAAADLSVKKWNKVTLVPLASDLKLLKEHLISKANSAASALDTDNNDQAAFKILLETVFCRIMLLNRRRPGELQRLPLYLYENTESQNQNYEEFSEAVTASEKVLMQKFKRIVIRGKRGRGVPVLFSLDVQQHIKILMQHRKNFFKTENIYLFGNPNTTQPICGYKVLQKYATSCGAKNPYAITATKLRKHLATLTQVLSMTESDVEQLASFMGHTVGVHKGSYRLPDDVYQTAKISKLLLLMEKGAAAEFKGKSLNEIELDLNDDLLESEELKTTDNEDEGREPFEMTEIETANDLRMDKIKENISKSKKKRLLVPWTEEQKKVVKSFFKDHIKKKIPPKQRECTTLKKQTAGLLDNKNWLKIKVYVQNQYSKTSKK